MNNETMNETAKFYMDKKISVHITLDNGRWYNGLIIQVGERSLVLQEEKYGELLVLFERIKYDGIMPRQEKTW